MTKVPRQEGADPPRSPQSDWVPLSRAYLYYRSTGYLHSSEDWQLHVENLVDSFAEDEGGEHPEPFYIGPADENRSLRVEALGLVLTISPQTARFGLAPEKAQEDDDTDTIRRLEGPALDFLEACRAYGGPSDLAIGVNWHRRLVDHLLFEQSNALANAVRRGAAHVMARTNDVLAPFDRIMADQLDYFRFAVTGADAKASLQWQGVLRGSSDGTMSGVGPAGEKLFSIHVAPGTELSAGESPREECLHWIRKIAAENPDKRPYTKSKMLALARRQFGKIPERAFFNMLARHQPVGWSLRPGRPTKLQREKEAKI